MLETPARVIETRGGFALVEADYGGGCGSGLCTKGGCGTAILAQIFTRTPRGPLRVSNAIGARPGDRVVVGVTEGSVLGASLAVYLLPLAFLLVGAVASRSLGGGDGGAALGAILGLFLGWGWARGATRRLAARADSQPVILRRL